MVPLEDDAQNTVFTVSLICVCLGRGAFCSVDLVRKLENLREIMV